ncbi:hypothetical protein [Kallotenue papyrolyticum]|uniref:hypothetical protein n=1 Tax=Kallotenue papyrolyticum TaxID=1325125 RepID=UPI0004786038|nr:hypothetical protein [Kallotenue papyrolyticum]
MGATGPAPLQPPDAHATAAPLEREETERGLTTDIGVPQPGSPLDEQGGAPLPESGGLAANDPAAGGDLAGSDQVDRATDAGATLPEPATGARRPGASASVLRRAVAARRP